MQQMQSRWLHMLGQRRRSFASSSDTKFQSTILPNGNVGYYSNLKSCQVYGWMHCCFLHLSQTPNVQNHNPNVYAMHIWHVFDEWKEPQCVNVSAQGRRAYFGTYLSWTPTFEWCVVRCDSKYGHLKEICLFIRGRTTCLKHDNHSKFCSQHDWRDLYDHLMTTRTSALIMGEIFMWSLKSTMKVATTSIRIC